MELCRSVGKYQAGIFIISAKIIWEFRFLYTKWSDFAAIHGAKRPHINPAVWLKINSTGKLLRFMNASLGSLSLIHRHYHQQVTLYLLLLLLLWPFVFPRTYNFISFSYRNSSPLSLDTNLPPQVFWRQILQSSFSKGSQMNLSWKMLKNRLSKGALMASNTKFV